MALFGLGKKAKKTVPEGFEIPSFPSTVLNLLSKLREPDISIQELAKELEIDPGLHVRVLKTVNSAAFGLSKKISNIQHAVNLLGRARLESLVLSVAVKDGLTNNNKAPWLDMTAFWKTASRRAAVAGGLAAELHPNLQSDVFTIGLLQDIGVPVLANREPERYRDIYHAWENDEVAVLTDEEKNCFGMDHATLGANMATDWGFPESLVEAIANHHDHGNGDIPLSLKVAALIKTSGTGDDTETILKKAEADFQIDTASTLDLIEDVLKKSQLMTSALD